jgi:hypothetical protein
MEAIIKIRGITLHVFYTKEDDKSWKDDEKLDINSVYLDNNDITDLCDYYGMFADIYEQLWKEI